MNAPNVLETMQLLGLRARQASRAMARAGTAARNQALRELARLLRANVQALQAPNERDLARAREAGLAEPLVDRLKLTPKIIETCAEGCEQLAAMPDVIGDIVGLKQQPSGIRVGQMRVPIGVFGMIYESRPNVTIEAASLSIKSGNACILRGGSEAIESSKALAALVSQALESAGLPPEAVQLVPTTDRAAVGALITMPEFVDVIIPRGGKGLVGLVQQEARVPVFAHLEGICHVYADADADLAKARRVVLNAKTRRTGICGAAECLLIDRGFYDRHGAVLVQDLLDAGVEVRAEGDLAGIAGTIPAEPSDFGQEFLDKIIAVKLVDGIDAAIAHIRRYGSGHTESILTENDATAQRFFNGLDSAILMRNASTQFADGGEFGMGAEIGIATGKMHARGPVGAEQLTSFKYLVTGDGTIRD